MKWNVYLFLVLAVPEAVSSHTKTRSISAVQSIPSLAPRCLRGSLVPYKSERASDEKDGDRVAGFCSHQLGVPVTQVPDPGLGLKPYLGLLEESSLVRTGGQEICFKHDTRLPICTFW